ncbi:MAG: hypothetical protein M3178_14720 [Pseudomonadota bacterium]|nr:hypothetical protein [Pseudomonadota bacterium]
MSKKSCWAFSIPACSVDLLDILVENGDRVTRGASAASSGNPHPSITLRLIQAGSATRILCQKRKVRTVS